MESRPHADVVIYDGDCRFCVANVARLVAVDEGKLAYVSLHDPLVRERWPDLTHEQLMREMYVMDQGGGRHGGAAAFRYLSRRIKGLWLLAPFLHIPGSLPFWQYLYRTVARIRYRFGRVEACAGGTCAVHFGEKE